LQALVSHLSSHLRSVESLLTRRCDLFQADLDALAARPREAWQDIAAELRALRAECGRLLARADHADEDRAQLWKLLRALRPEGDCAESCAAESPSEQADLAERQNLMEARLIALVEDLGERLEAETSRTASEREQGTQLATRAAQRQEELAREVAEERQAREAGQKELLVLLGSSQRQSARQLRLAEEGFRERSEALEKAASEATAELEKRLEALQGAHTEASEGQESRLQLALRGKEELSSGLASLGRKLNERHAQLSGKLEEALGEMAEQGEIFSLKLSTETLSLRGELSEMMTELSGKLDGHKSRLDQQHWEHGNAIAAVDTRLIDQRRDILAKLLAESSTLESNIDERACKLGKEICEAKSIMDERQKRLVSQIRVDHALLQDAIGKNVAETQVLDLKLKHVGEMLQEQIRSSIQAHEQQQQAQLRLLAEDADERANVFAMELKAEGQQRDHAEAEMRQEIHSCSDRCAHLQEDVGDLRAVLRAQIGETVGRRDEADAAAVRDGLIPMGFGGTAIATAALLL